MNQRIRDFAEHCDFYVGNEHYNQSHEEKQRLWTEKFAELIVRECVKQSKEIQSQTIANGTEDYCAGREMGIEVVINEITRHFGIQA
jgi:hypothetical protein